MQIRCRDSELFTWFERPALIVALTARMLLAAGLFIALFLKLYMYVLTDLRCAADIDSLGNAIRCTSVAEMIAGALIFVAGLGVAAALFSRDQMNVGETLVMVLCAVTIGFLAQLDYASATWQTAAVILTLTAAISGLLFMLRLLGSGVSALASGADPKSDP